jgi:hypothetical protein
MIIIGSTIKQATLSSTTVSEVDTELLSFNQTPAGTAPGPINNYYRRYLYKTIYTSAECSAAGLSNGTTILTVKLFVLSQPTYQPYPNYTVGIQNTESAVGSDLTTNWTTIYGPSSTSFVIDTFFTITLETPFVYTGNNLALGFAWGQSPTNYSSTGIVRSNSSGSSRFARADSAGTYTLTNTAGSTQSGRPVIYLTIVG